MKMGNVSEHLKIKMFWENKTFFLETWKKSVSEFQNKNINIMNFNQMFQSNLADVSKKINMHMIL